jgi:hypothetical protein
MIKLTETKIGFISDPALGDILLNILGEIDRVYLAEAYRSTLYLSISAVEGILKHVIKLNLSLAQSLPSYPSKKGNPKKFEKLSLQDSIKICSSISLIPAEFEKTYDELRKLRNFIHPDVELASQKNIHLGMSQIALGLLNTSLEHLQTKRFIDKSIWTVKTGNPSYNLANKTVKLDAFPASPTHSFMLTDSLLKKDFEITSELFIPSNAILNFVYNFQSEDDFLMARIDTRSPNDDGLFVCPSRFQWRKKSEYQTKPSITANKCLVKISFIKGSFLFTIDGNKLQFNSCDWDFNPDRPLGFFNQLDFVTLQSFSVKII